MEERERALTGIVHLCILFQLVGLAISFVIFFLEKDNSSFIQKGVKQAIGLQVLISIFVLVYKASLILGLVPRSGVMATVIILGTKLLYLPVIGLAFYAALKSFKGNYFEYPIIGGLVRRFNCWN